MFELSALTKPKIEYDVYAQRSGTEVSDDVICSLSSRHGTTPPHIVFDRIAQPDRKMYMGLYVPHTDQIMIDLLNVVAHCNHLGLDVEQTANLTLLHELGHRVDVTTDARGVEKRFIAGARKVIKSAGVVGSAVVVTRLGAKRGGAAAAGILLADKVAREIDPLRELSQRYSRSESYADKFAAANAHLAAVTIQNPDLI